MTKEEKKDEMKNRISMALKEPILQQGFEIICKENAQLKEANETLATMNNNMWVELEKKRAESQGITNKLHQLIKAKIALRNVIDYLGQFCSDYPDCVIEAEKILKDLEK